MTDTPDISQRLFEQDLLAEYVANGATLLEASKLMRQPFFRVCAIWERIVADLGPQAV